MAGHSVIHAAAATTTSLPQSAPRAKKHNGYNESVECLRHSALQLYSRFFPTLWRSEITGKSSLKVS